MTVLPIRRWPHPDLSQTCAAAEPGSRAEALAQDMLDTMYDAPGRGLAAPQIGVLTRLFVMDVTWKEGTPTPQVFLNPQITWRAEEMVDREEGCLSIPGLLVTVTRPAEIDVTWQDATGAPHSGRFSGFAAACIQHEMDHLDGVVTLDRISETDREAALQDYAGTA